MAFNPQDHMGKLKGKDYLEVKWRIVWFRQENPAGRIDTDVKAIGDNAIVKAIVWNNDGVQIASGMATVRSADNARMSWAGRDFEKAETAAIGRALGVAGYGTQFTGDELNEDNYLADSPVTKNQTWLADESQVAHVKLNLANMIDLHGEDVVNEAKAQLDPRQFASYEPYLEALIELIDTRETASQMADEVNGAIAENSPIPDNVTDFPKMEQPEGTKTAYNQTYVDIAFNAAGKRYYKIAGASMFSREAFRQLGFPETFTDLMGEKETEGRVQLPMGIKLHVTHITRTTEDGRTWKEIVHITRDDTGVTVDKNGDVIEKAG